MRWRARPLQVVDPDLEVHHLLVMGAGLVGRT
jgi:hypothetical protein